MSAPAAAPARWRLLVRPTLEIPCLTAAADAIDWTALSPLPALDGPDADADLRATDVRAAFTAEALHVRFLCPFADARTLRPQRRVAGFDASAHVTLELSPENDPGRWLRFRADFRGLREAVRVQRITGESNLQAVPDAWETTAPHPARWHRYHGLERDHWWVHFILPWRALGHAARPATLGLRYARAERREVESDRLRLASWPHQPGDSSFPGLDHAQLIPAQQGGAPVGLELEPLAFGVNRGVLRLHPVAAPSLQRLRVSVNVEAQTLSTTEHPVAACAAEVDFTFVLPRAMSSHLDRMAAPRLRLELLDAAGQLSFTAALPLDRHLGLLVDERYGQPAPATTGDELQDWLSGIIASLPRLQRRDTNAGAPSDFCLYDDAGAMIANLTGPEAWTALGKLIETRFTTRADRLLAAMALIGQKSVTNLVILRLFFDPQWRCNYHTPMHKLMGPLSVLRYGGGGPQCRAAALAWLLRHVTDPQTGAAFHTRVVSLDQRGGPRPVRRSYAGHAALAGLDQEPGPIGAVAVQLDDARFTLLDPTAMTFFATEPGKLVDGQTISADASLRTRCAGRLAGCYAGLNLAEVQRWPLDELLTRGVFPELFPDEAGPDQPFDPRLVQTPPLVRCGVGEAGPQSQPFVSATGGAPARPATVAAAWTERGLQLCVTVTGINPAALDDADRAWERVHVAVDPEHGHADFFHFAAGWSGSREAARECTGNIQTLCKHLTTESWTVSETLSAGGWTADWRDVAAGYAVTFTLPWSLLEVSDPATLGPTLGLNVWIDSRHPTYRQSFLAPPPWNNPACAFQFADLQLVSAPLRTVKLDFGYPVWGQNQGQVTLENLTAAPLTLQWQAQQTGGMQPWRVRCAPVSVTLPARATQTIAFPFPLDGQEKMTSGSSPKLELRAWTDDQVLFQQTVECNYCGPMFAFHAYGPDVPAVSKPQPGEADYLPRLDQWIRQRLPKLVRQTTRDGAPSDFCVVTEDGAQTFNLMQAGVLDQIGRFIAERFDSDLERVLGLLWFNYHPAVARHMSSGHRFMDGAGPLSILRGNFAGAGGNCGYHSRAFAGLLAHLPLSYGLPKAHTVSVWGHVISCLEDVQGCKLLIDGDVGHFWLSPDGARLASSDELAQHGCLPSTANSAELARYFMYEPTLLNRVPVRDDTFPGVFPAGAPRA